jgi:hypothetical protein
MVPSNGIMAGRIHKVARETKREYAKTMESQLASERASGGRSGGGGGARTPATAATTTDHRAPPVVSSGGGVDDNKSAHVAGRLTVALGRWLADCLTSQPAGETFFRVQLASSARRAPLTGS